MMVKESWKLLLIAQQKKPIKMLAYIGTSSRRLLPEVANIRTNEVQDSDRSEDMIRD